MGGTDVTIRPADPDDAEAMGHLHVRAWQAAYRGVMPDAYLDSLDPAQRADWWRTATARTDVPPVLVAVVDGAVVGFAAYGAENTSERSLTTRTGELYALNLDPEHWGHGIGRRLLQAVTAELAALGYDDAVLWVVPENIRARALYESDGWADDGATESEEIQGVTVTDMRYRRRLASNSTA